MKLLKKFAATLAFGAAIAFGNFQTAWAYPESVAVITNYDEVANRVEIYRANGEPESAALLYPGDMITGDVDAVKIDCAPSANFFASHGVYIILNNSLSNILAAAPNVAEYASTPWVDIEFIPTTNRGDKKFNLNPRPGFNVTLLMNQSVHFEWNEKSETQKFVITDENGKKVFEKFIGDACKIDIIPSEAKLKSGKKYSWSGDGKHKYTFTILDEQSEKEILDTLTQIDEKNLSHDECILMKANFVQIVSEREPNRFDLYWLSAQWLLEIPPTAENKVLDSQFAMLEKCEQHLNEKM